MRKVFVSYSRNNLEVVTQLVEDLQAVGMTTWHDQTLTGGQRWWDNILANIRDCEIFIFALSTESWSRRRAGASWPMFVDSASPFFRF